jgi:hypothetical protein
MNGKIVLVNCPIENIECKKNRLVINRDFYASQNYFLNKDYHGSILALKNAYYKTTELHSTSCFNCAELFRSTITQSLEYIQEDLFKMSTGFFKAKRFQSSFELAGTVLEEMKKEG